MAAGAAVAGTFVEATERRAAAAPLAAFARIRSMNAAALARGLRLEAARHAQAGAIVALITLYLSAQILLQPNLLDFLTPLELAWEWLAYFGELAALAATLTLAYVGIDGLSRRLAWSRLGRLGAMAAALYLAAFAVVVAQATLRNRLAVAPDVSLAAAWALRWAVIALYAVAVQTLWQHVRDTDSKAIAAQAGAEALARERQQLRLQLLKSQIEPHFLFNTLANVRRLYRTDAERGGHMMESLKRYLRAALPGIRRDDATLAGELDLVRAYLELIAVRMGTRLTWHVSDDSGRGSAAFPAMVVLTLVENAIKHGIEPAPAGGRIDVRAALTSDGSLRIEVRDDGVGIGGAESGGTGVGLANIRSQLQARYGVGARVTIVDARPGVVSRVFVPAQALA